AGVEVSMDGRGRWMDNRFIERLWRSAKYEDIYLQDYDGGLDTGRGLGRWFDRYNEERPHQALGYATPSAAYLPPDSPRAKPGSGDHGSFSLLESSVRRRLSQHRQKPMPADLESPP